MTSLPTDPVPTDPILARAAAAHPDVAVVELGGIGPRSEPLGASVASNLELAEAAGEMREVALAVWRLLGIADEPVIRWSYGRSETEVRPRAEGHLRDVSDTEEIIEGAHGAFARAAWTAVRAPAGLRPLSAVHGRHSAVMVGSPQAAMITARVEGPALPVERERARRLVRARP